MAVRVEKAAPPLVAAVCRATVLATIADMSDLIFKGTVDEIDVTLLADAQTSGGLLFGVEPAAVDAVLEEPGGDVLALFREMHDVGCPPSKRLYVDAMRGAGCPEIATRLL